MRKLHTFHGGVHPEEHKQESSGLPSTRAPMPKRLVLPLQQHIGAKAKAVVQTGDKVLKGQLIAQAEGMVSAAIHAPTSGTILSVDLHSVPHPSGLYEICATIEPDGEDRWIEHVPLDFRALAKPDLLMKLRDGGIVGLGGATFPSHVKFISNTTQKVQTLILNGAECEPWITTDDRLMRERAAEIVQGIEILRYLAEPSETLIGIEDNKPEAIAAMQQACANTNIEVVTVPTLYPTGGERQLIKILTGKEVPSGGLPLSVGVVCSNVATAYTVHRLVNHGEPMISRMVTITGNIKVPQNIEILIGTPIEELVQYAGGDLPDSEGYILGGPMMGMHITDGRLPMVKGINCIIVKSEKLFSSPPPALPCIRCTRCAQACPADLQPQELYWFSKAKDFAKAQEYNLLDCIECGTCAFVCPSNIPLVQYYRFAKSEISARAKDAVSADAARVRHEFRVARTERDKREKAEKLALQKEKNAKEAARKAAEKAAAATADATTENAEQSLIQAAAERAKQQTAAAKPQNTEHLTPAQQAQIAEIEARRSNAQALEYPDTELTKE